MRHQVDPGRRSTSPKFSEPFVHLLLVCQVVLVRVSGGVGSFGGWWILGSYGGFWVVMHDAFGGLFPNFAFSTDGVSTELH